MPAKTTITGIAALCLIAAPVLAACSQPSDRLSPAARSVPVRPSHDAAAASPDVPAAPSPSPSPATLPGLGAKLLAQIPSQTRQVLIDTGDRANSPTGHATLYVREGDAWTAGPSWPTHNALRGWTRDHHEGDLHTPIGVFALTDAGGRLPNPGGLLPYDHSRQFVISGTGFEGEPLAGAFDYVVAINYNRVPGTSPLDETEPMGTAKGGGVWLHVDHGGPTHGCISLPRDGMVQLIDALDPALHPVIVMGDAADLAAS